MLNILLPDSLGAQGPCLAHSTRDPAPNPVPGLQPALSGCMYGNEAIMALPLASLWVSPGQTSHPVGLCASPVCDTQQAFDNVGFSGIGLGQRVGTHAKPSLT